VRALLAAVVAALTIGTLPPAAAAQTYPPNPFDGRALFVDPASPAARDAAALGPQDPAVDELRAIAAESTADWFGDWNPVTSVQADVAARVDEIVAAGAYPVLVAYNIPLRDCGSYSGGGAAGPAAYRAWVDAFRAGIGTRRAAVILEPDALAGMDCLDPADRSARVAMLADATRRLATGGNVAVYLDAGHAGWIAPDVMARRLVDAGVVHARGFALNVSNFGRTADQVAYGKRIAPTIGWKRFVVDTSRNGLGPAVGIDDAWCNPPGRGLGEEPTGATGDRLVDAFLWIKRPGESDGTCRGGPPAGTWWRDYAVGLAARAA
jgi:endoglucanase